MNELEKCMAGEYYNCHDKIFIAFKTQARELLQAYNALAYEQKEEKEKILNSIGSARTYRSDFLLSVITDETSISETTCLSI